MANLDERVSFGRLVWSLWIFRCAFAPVLGVAELQPGLEVEFRSGGQAEHGCMERPALFVSSGATPSPMLNPGPFAVSWSGFLSAELRSDFLFRAEFSGKCSLQINGKQALQGAGTDQTVTTEKPVRLNKGTNQVWIGFQSSVDGDSYLRLFWGEKEFLLQPIPQSSLSHLPSSKEREGVALREGRDLFAEFRCLRCHIDPALSEGMAELAMDAPVLDGIGSRRNFDWLRRWIADPSALRVSARMPKLFAGPKAEERSRAVAAYLVSLKEADIPASASPDSRKTASQAGSEVPGLELPPLFERFHCSACHTLGATNAPGPESISLAEVGRKFSPGKLEEFLLKPQAHFRWIRMPDFHLSREEANELAAFLRSSTTPSETVEDPADVDLVSKGRDLVRSSGCLNCHSLRLENQFSTRALSLMKQRDWNRGCLAAGETERGQAPAHAFSRSEREHLQALGRTDLRSLGRHESADFAARQARHLRCQSCHGPVAGIPAFEVLGGKLTPEWAAAFIGGEVSYKPRAERHPRGEIWLPARMPSFPAYASGLASGMALSHGLPERSKLEASIDRDAAETGRKLVGKDGGFSCASCHAVGKVPALEVFESEGINLAYSGRRLQRSYFDRWMRSPLSIDSQTKMPAYFDEEGQSQLGEVLDGQAVKQIQAIWQYLRLGDSMDPPQIP